MRNNSTFRPKFEIGEHFSYNRLLRCSTASARGSISRFYMGGPTMMKVLLVYYEKDGTMSMYDQGAVVVPGEVVGNHYFKYRIKPASFHSAFWRGFFPLSFSFSPLFFCFHNIRYHISHTRVSLSLSQMFSLSIEYWIGSCFCPAKSFVSLEKKCWRFVQNYDILNRDDCSYSSVNFLPLF